MPEKILFKTSKFIFKELVLDVIYFPVWWYTKGLKKAWIFFTGEVSDWANRLSLKILFKSMFKPMYGDYSRSGRIISFFMRIIVFGFKLILMVIWLTVLLVIFLLWAVMPVFIVYLIILNITGQRGLF
ncbi:MAG: hypothetical protein ABIH38_05240 [Patescibacteria group bacterium]